MSDVSYNLSVIVNKGALSQQFNASNVTAVMNSAGLLALTLNLGTATTQIATSTMGTLGLAFARSLVTSTVTTHTVSFGRLDGTTLYESVRLKPGDAAVLRMAPGNYAARGAVEGSRLLLTVLED